MNTLLEVCIGKGTGQYSSLIQGQLKGLTPQESFWACLNWGPFVLKDIEHRSSRPLPPKTGAGSDFPIHFCHRLLQKYPPDWLRLTSTTWPR